MSTLSETNLNQPSSAYVHIPFCRRRCYYCDFPVSVVGDRARGETSHSIAHYVEVLCQEIQQAPNLGLPLKTVFFGGGTPSLLSVAQLHQILTTLEHHLGITTTAEIAIEIDPGTFTLEQLQGYQAAGVNRVSLGVQAFQPELLAACGRTHSLEDVYTATDLIRQVNLPNFSLDLISGLPHQTIEQWQESLERAITIAPKHLSVYDLIVEPVTAFGRQYQPGVEPLPSDTLAAEMYRMAQKTLTAAGYEHYEISNYAQPDYQCRHNRVYWENRPFYGFGMGATSYLSGERFARPRTTREYYQWVAQQRSGELPPGSSDPSNAENEQLLDTLMLGLRLAEGLSIATLTKQFGTKTVGRVLACLQPHIQQGWVEVITATERIQLSDPEGFLFSNVVLSDLFAALA